MTQFMPGAGAETCKQSDAGHAQACYLPANSNQVGHVMLHFHGSLYTL